MNANIYAVTVRVRESWRQVWTRLRGDSGMLSVEYMLILALVVLPLGLLILALAPQMIKLYGDRMVEIVALPFP
ncbi:MAG: hypothetical protein WCI73_16485 [Phycisphaerae bacterium]